MSYSDIGALSIRLNLETGSFNKKISSINKEIKFLERDFKSASKGIENFENSFRGIGEKITKLSKQIELSNTKLATQKKQMEEYAKALRKQGDALEELGRTQGKSSTEYKQQAKLVEQIASKMRSLDTAIKTTEGQLRDYNKQLSDTKEKMSTLGDTSKTFAQKLEDVQRESRLTASEFEKMTSAFEDGTFAHAKAEIKQLSASLQSAKNEAQVYRTEINQLETTQNELARTEKRLSGEIQQVGYELTVAKNRFGENSAVVEKLNAKLADLKQTLMETKSKHTENASAIIEHKTELNNLETQANLTARQLQAIPMERVSRAFSNAGTTMMNTGAVLSASVGLPMMMVGKTAVTTAMNFEEGMSKVQAITGESAEVMGALEEQARHLGATTQFSAIQASEAMSYLGMSGMKAEDIMKSMPATLDIAKAGMMDLGTTADITTNIMSGFAMGADDFGHIGDVLAYAASNANTNIEQMGEAMVYLAPVGETLGLSLEDVSSAVMTVSNAGIQGARAGAAFSTSLVRLTKPTAEMESLMEELGISFQTSEGKLKPISEIVGHLNDKFEGMSDAQKAASINTLFGAEATKHWAALLNEQEGVLESNTKALENADGTAAKMAETMGDNLAGSIKEMKSKLEEMAITVGNTLRPTIEKTADVIGDLVEWFQDLSPRTQETVVQMGLLAVTLPVAVTAFGILAGSIGNIFKLMDMLPKKTSKVSGGITDVGKKTGKIGSVMSKVAPLLMNPWTALAAGVAVGATALYGFKKKADAELKEIESSAKNSITGVGEYLEVELPEKLKNAEEQIQGIEYFDESTKANLMRNTRELEEALASGKENVSQEANVMVESVLGSLDQVPEGMRQSIVDGLAEFVIALETDGKLAAGDFDNFIKELNEVSKVKIEVDYGELRRKKQAGAFYEDFADSMENVGSSIETVASDVQQTVRNTSEVMKKAKDEDIETQRLLAQGIAEHVSNLDMSAEEQSAILTEMAHTLTKELDPEIVTMLLQEFGNAMGLGFDDLTALQSKFLSMHEKGNVDWMGKTGEIYAQYIMATDDFTNVLSGKYGLLSEGSAGFWADFVATAGNGHEDVVLKTQQFVSAFIGELKQADSPEAILGVSNAMTKFIEEMIIKGNISTEEAATIIANINNELGQITPEVATTITANLDDFTENEQEILRKLGVLDETESSPSVTLDHNPAVENMNKMKGIYDEVIRGVEEDKADIDMDNEKALEKIDEVNETKVEDKKATINLEYSTIPGLYLPNLKQYIDVIPQQQSFSIPIPTMTEEMSYQLARTGESFNSLKTALNQVSYSGAMYRSQAPSLPKVTQVTNSNDSTMISLLQTMVGEITKLQEKHQTLEAQFYIDGKQLKSHFETMEKRQNRLGGR